MKRSIRTLLVVALVAGTMASIPLAAARTRPAPEPGMDGIGGGTGVLPNFHARGSNLIRLQAGAFDPVNDPRPTQPGIPLVDESTVGIEPQYWVAQVRSQRFADATDAIESAGATIAGYLHDDAYMVRANAGQIASISSSPAVRWTGLYQPAWKVPIAASGKKGLLELGGEQIYRVYFFATDPGLSESASALQAIPGVTVVDNGGVVVDVRATRAQVRAIASIPAVEWISVKPEPRLLNANARWVTDTGVRDVHAATATGRLTGAGQTAAVADTAINYTYDLNGRAHVAFRDCNPDGSGCKEAIYTQAAPGTATANMTTIVNHDTDHRKMVAFFDLGSTGPNPYDPSSHGSHTAGSVDGDQPPHDQYTGEDGLAPAANHVHQNIGTAAGGLAIPGDLYQLFRQAYRPRSPASVQTTSADANGNPPDHSPGCEDPPPVGTTVPPSTCYRPLEDARTHNNSWGLIAPLVDPGYASDVDQFVWDHEDMMIVASVGNDGPSPGTIIAPSIAKSDLSSGASANGRQPMSSIDSMAQFSSHGPTGDGRFGPDLATPGQIVVSSKGGTTDGYHTAQGTSMSGPVLTGLTTLVRQYFFDGYAASGGDGFAAGSPAASRRHNPSAALVKAAMINGAVRMRGFYTGDDGNLAAQDGQWPSRGQGFGRVNLDNSLYFDQDPARNWYLDVYRADSTEPETCPEGATPAACTSFPVSNSTATREFTMHVDEGQPLDVSLAWTDAPDLLTMGTPALVNNLDLIVVSPDGTTYAGNNMNTRTSPGADVAQTNTGSGTSARDTRNPVERVRIPEPAPGDYTIRVEATRVTRGNQGFALAASGDLSPAGGDAFTPGPALQQDQPGNPTISNVRVTPISADTAQIHFQTSEPTTAVANVDLAEDAEGVTTYEDSYNEDNSDDDHEDAADEGFPGLNEDPAYIETSQEYADRLVVGTSHEILLTGLSGGNTYNVELAVTDLAENAIAGSATVRTPASVFQPQAGDIAQCASAAPSGAREPDCRWAGLPHDQPPRPQGPALTSPPTPNDNFGTQMYASGGSNLGAFMFRTPEEFDPATITGAAVEMVSAHNWTIPYTQDPVYTVDLLNEGVESSWRSSSYSSLRSAAAPARAFPETTHRRGGYYRYAFTFRCGDLEALRTSLENDRAAFRWDADTAGLFSMDIGFNRRSRGPALRPRLVLYTGGTEDPVGEPCVDGPAPTISNVGIHNGITDAGDDTEPVTVSWETDVPSDSLVLFRPEGTASWTQVGTPRLTRVHHVEVLGLDPTARYEFAVRSRACDGDTTTDTNGGRGYDFFRQPPDPGPRTEHAFYDFEADEEGWTVENIDDHEIDPLDPENSDPFGDAVWTRDNDGASDEQNPDGSRDDDPEKFAWHVEPYHEYDETTLTSSPVTIPGRTVGVEFFSRHDTELDFDFLYVEYSEDGTSWSTAAAISGLNEHYPAYDPYDVKFNHPTPGGALQIRFRFFSDQLIASPLHEGVAVDKVAFASYPNATSTEELPLSGPAPAPSADATGLNPPATREGASEQDLAAGTGMCATPKPPPPPPPPPSSQRCPTTGKAGKGPNVVVGTPGNDRLKGTKGRDILCGLGGRDRLKGKKGRDLLLGGDGRDRLAGGGGRDLLRGGKGVDRMNGGGKRDRCHGGPGRERVTKCEEGGRR